MIDFEALEASIPTHAIPKAAQALGLTRDSDSYASAMFPNASALWFWVTEAGRIADVPDKA